MSRFFPTLSVPGLKQAETRQFNVLKEFCQASKSKPQIEENPFFSKYADKIAAKYSTCPEELQSRMKSLNIESKPSAHVEQNLFHASPDTSEKQQKTTLFSHEKKTLDSIMKLELLQDKSAADIETLWKEYYNEKQGLYAVLSSVAYKTMYSRLQDYPTFLFSLPKDQGYEFIMSQYYGNSCYFTSLINYQTHKENAPVCLTITYYPELQETKGIVLMRGEFDTNALKVHEAQCLTNQLQLFYGGSDPKKDKLLWTFNKSPQTFEHMDLITELECLN